MKQVFTAWAKAGETELAGFTLGEAPPRLVDGDPAFDGGVVPLWRVEADTWEEAMAIRNLRCGYAPYQPVGPASPCPDCGAPHYAEGSGQCWRCGHGVISAG